MFKISSLSGFYPLNSFRALKKLTALCGALAIGLISPLTVAESIDLSLSASTARGEFQGKFRTDSRKDRRFRHMNDLNYGFNFLYHEDDGHVGGVSLHVAGRSKATVFKQETGIGGKLITFDAGGPDGGALAVGGYILHNLASANLLSVRGELYYAPSVVTFGDGNRYAEYSVRLQYQLVDQANVYIGYRNIEVDFERFGDVEIDDSAHVGLMMYF